MEARTRNNPPKESTKPLRLYSPKIIEEWERAFLTGIRILHDNGRTWVEVSKVIGVSTTELERYRYRQKTPKQPALFFLCESLGCSLAELLMMGQEE